MKNSWDKSFSLLGHVGRQKWNTPALDIYYSDENTSHVWSDANYLPATPKHLVFPLVKRPFNGRFYPGPRDPRAFLKHIFNPGSSRFDCNRLCRLNTWNYLLSEVKPEEDRLPDVPCAALLDYFPFVQHVRGPGDSFCREELVFRGEVQDTFERSAHDIPVC